METWIIELFIAMAATMFFCGWMSGKWYARKRPNLIRKDVVVYHDYKTSTDYARLYKLLMDGRHIVRVKRFPSGYFVTYEMEKCEAYYQDGFTFTGMGDDVENFNNISEEDFINYCKWKKFEYLDQI